MNCAKCWIKGVLLLEHHEGVTVMECTRCVGFWLDRNDIDDIVDVAFSKKELTKLFDVVDEDTDFTCLHCGMLLKNANYAGEKLKVGICPLGHGWYWENPKKEKREVWMKNREKAMKKALGSKKSWKEFLRGVKSWELIDILSAGMKGKRSGAIEKARKEIEKKMKEMEERRMRMVQEQKSKTKKKAVKKSGRKVTRVVAKTVKKTKKVKK